MNILIIITIIFLIVAVLTFLTPWISKTIEEPFVGACLSPTTLTPLLPSSGSGTSWRDYIEEGKQRYNFLGFLQSHSETPVFDKPSALGSIDPLPNIETGIAPITTLNDNIRSALETVDVVPKKVGPIISPDIQLVPAEYGADGNLLQKAAVNLTNAAAFLASSIEHGPLGKQVSYVEERLGPKNTNLTDAAKCEVTNMFYNLKAAQENDNDILEERGIPINRHQMCDLLNSSTETTITNAFGAEQDKKCGVCLKHSEPANDPAVYNPGNRAYNGIGGLYVSQGAINTAVNNGTAIRPTLGTCAEGYFFIPKDTPENTNLEVAKCKAAADRLNCEEIAERGFNGGVSKDRRDVSGSDCYACLQPEGPQFVYYKPPSDGNAFVRMRVVIPTGIGRTRIIASVVGKGRSYGPYLLTSRRTGTANAVVVAETSVYINNVLYFVVEANPADVIRVTAYQEFPHRPRGVREVFFVQFPTVYEHGTDAEGAAILADSLDCDVATKTQLEEAQSKGMQVCNAGWASDGKVYVVRSSTVATNNFAVTGAGSDVLCAATSTTPLAGVGGVVEVTAPPISATGVWCYGIKPTQSHLEGSTESAGFPAPRVENFYTYYKRVDESRISPEDKKPIASAVASNLDNRPQFRGILVQLERNNSATTNLYEPINVGIEDYMTRVNGVDLTALTIKSLANRMQHYSRNGRFNDSVRIATPKPSLQETTPVYGLINSNLYWIWSRQEDRSQKFEAEIEVPGYFAQPTYEEDLPKCSSVLHTAQRFLDRVRIPACDAGIDDNDTSGCLSYLFKAAGGDIERGTLSPRAQNPTTAMNNRRFLLYKDYNSQNPAAQLRQTRNKEEIEALLSRFVRIMTGLDASLAGISDEEKITKMNDASMKLKGIEAIGPCERVVVSGSDMSDISIELKSGVLDAQCLDFLYRNTTPNANRASDVLKKPTYSDIRTRFSGLDYPGGEYTTATAEDINANPYKACQPKGSWAPLINNVPNTQAISEINAQIQANRSAEMNAIEKAIKVFNDLHKTANDQNVNRQDQSDALDRCYGVKKKEYRTNCTGIAAKTLFLYDLDGGFLIGNNFATITAKESSDTPASVVLTEALKDVDIFEYQSFLTKDYVVVTTDPMFGVNSDEFLSKLFVHSATMGGSNIVNPDATVTRITKNVNNTEKSASFVLGIVEATSATNPNLVTKMVQVKLQIQGAELRAKCEAAKFGGPLVEQSLSSEELLRIWNAGTTQSIATSATGPGFGIKSIGVGFTVKMYTPYQWTESETVSITSNSDSNMKFSSEVKTCASNTSKNRVFQGNGAELTRGVDLPGCGVAWCCTAYQPYYTVSGNKNIGYVSVQRKLKSPIGNQVLVIGKDLSGVIAQKVMTVPGSHTDPPGVLQFQQEDVRPLISYKEIDGGLGIKGTTDTNLRFESAIGERFFLSADGTVPNLPEQATGVADTSTKFMLTEKVSSNLSIASANVYSIRELNSKTNYLQKGTAADDTVSSKDTETNADWSIEPAINGAYAFVSLQLVNLPGYYLVAEKQVDNTYRAVAKVINRKDDIEGFFACWRLYPA